MEIEPRVSPNAGRTAVGLYEDDAIRLYIVPTPTDGEASVEIVRGARSQNEIVSVKGIERAETDRVLSGFVR